MGKIDTVVFDLDGTLLDSLEDLADSMNYALRSHGYAERTLDEVRRFVGNGVRLLVERGLPGGADNPQFDEVLDCFKRYYVGHCMLKTAPYPGVAELLGRLKAAGYHTAIVSNKLQSGVDELYTRFFADTVEVAVGEQPGMRRKPAPDMVDEALRRLGASRSQAVYVGDSDVDVATAARAGLPCISVLWGFRDRAFLEAHGATCFVERPEAIMALLESGRLPQTGGHQSSNE